MAANVDASEVRAFAAVLDAKGNTTKAGVTSVVSHGALNIKNQLQAEARRSRWFEIAPAISYTVRDVDAFGGGLVEAEIGPDKRRRRAARLANIAYFGGANGGGGTLPDPQGALDAEMPRFLEALADLGGDLQ